MDDNSVDELSDDLIVATPPVTELVIKGVMIVTGIVGFLGFLRWMESGLVGGYRVGSAGFAAMFLMLVAWDFASGQVPGWRNRQFLWHVGAVALCATNAVIGPP